MIIDSSAMLAILLEESDADYYEAMIAGATHRRISTANFLETAMVFEGRLGFERGGDVDRYIEAAHIQIEPVTADHARRAREAWRRFGKGNHPAGLNFGDCFAYALAEAMREPLLFKGDDFARTDIDAA